MFKSRFLRFLAAEVGATASGRFGFLWIGSVLLALCVSGSTLVWAAGRVGWPFGLPLALVAGFMSGGVSFWGVMLFLALVLDRIVAHPRWMALPPEPSPLEVDSDRG